MNNVNWSNALAEVQNSVRTFSVSSASRPIVKDNKDYESAFNNWTLECALTAVFLSLNELEMAGIS